MIHKLKDRAQVRSAAQALNPDSEGQMQDDSSTDSLENPQVQFECADYALGAAVTQMRDLLTGVDNPVALMEVRIHIEEVMDSLKDLGKSIDGKIAACYFSQPLVEVA